MKYPNWFEITGAQDNFARHLEYYKDKPVKFLQIGAFTGDASVWMLKNILTHPDSMLIDVDTWQGSDEKSHNEMDFDDVFAVYTERVKGYKNINPIRATSDEFFANSKIKFDFIYVDGDHTAFGVMKDLINAHSHINTNGIIACDDYHWSEGKGMFYEPRPAIDAFFNMTRDLYEVIEIGYQVWFRDARSV